MKSTERFCCLSPVLMVHRRAIRPPIGYILHGSSVRWGRVIQGHLAQAHSCGRGQKVVFNLKNKSLSAVHEIGEG